MSHSQFIPADLLAGQHGQRGQKDHGSRTAERRGLGVRPHPRWHPWHCWFRWVLAFFCNFWASWGLSKRSKRSLVPDSLSWLELDFLVKSWHGGHWHFKILCSRRRLLIPWLKKGDFDAIWGQLFLRLQYIWSSKLNSMLLWSSIKHVEDWIVKVSQFRNVFLVSSNSSKKPENNLTWGAVVVRSNFFVRFSEELKIPKIHFEIKWPVGTIL